jgi:hypothetical protein
MTTNTLTNAFTGRPIYIPTVDDELRAYGRELTETERAGQAAYRARLATDRAFARREGGWDL